MALQVAAVSAPSLPAVSLPEDGYLLPRFLPTGPESARGRYTKAAAQEGAPPQDMLESFTLRLPHLDSSASELVLHPPPYAPPLSSPEQQSGVAL